MNNFGTTSRNRYSKPPVIRKQSIPVRSPSSSRLTNGLSCNSNGGYLATGTTNGYPSIIYNRQQSPASSSLTHQFNNLSSISKKVGSCQNLINLDYQPLTTNYTSRRIGTKLDPYNGTKSIKNSSNATNNSYSTTTSHQASLSSSNRSNFYNGYYEQTPKSSASSSVSATNHNYPLTKSRYATKLSTTTSAAAAAAAAAASSSDSSSESPETNHTSSSNLYTSSNTTNTTTTTTTTNSRDLPPNYNNYKSQSTTNSTSSSYNQHNPQNVAASGTNKSQSFNTMSATASSTGTVATVTGATKSYNNNFNSNKGLVGLVNLGNTCFMNSVLQCLSNCRILQEYCTNGRYDDDLNPNSKTKGLLFKSYADLIRLMWKSESDQYVSPDKFKRTFQKIAPSFHGTAQQDSQEFLRIMLEGLHQDVNRVQVRPKPLKYNEEEDEKLPDIELAQVYWSRYIRVDNSFVVDLFVGQLKSTLLCKKCGYKSITFDPFWDLSLPIPKVHRNNTLNACLDLFTSEEILDGDEMPKCSRCRQKRPCSKSFSIQKFPQMLVIHLKRFSGDRFRSKISASIDFPLINLDLNNYAADTCRQSRVSYNLYGVSNHSGTVHGGHYTAYCCNPYSQHWYEFNDTRVSRVNESSVCSSEAYVLFYQMN